MFNSVDLSKNTKYFFFWLFSIFFKSSIYPIGEIRAIQPLSLYRRNTLELCFLPRGLESRRTLLVLKSKFSKNSEKSHFLTLSIRFGRLD
jgi:hypothetical protein